MTIRDRVREWLGLNWDASVAHQRQVAIHDHLHTLEVKLDELRANTLPRISNGPPPPTKMRIVDWDTMQATALRDLEKEN